MSTHIKKPDEVVLYKAQEWNTDEQDWNDMEHEGAVGRNKSEVEFEARYHASQCACRVRTRVIPT